MAEWRVHLQGDEFDLEQLAALFTSPHLRIRKEEGIYFLTSDRFNTLTDADAVRKAANDILEPLFGSARLRFGAQKAFNVGNLRRIEDDGRSHHYLLLEGASVKVRGSAVVAVVGGTNTTEQAQQEDPLVSWSVLSESDEMVARVLRLYAKANQVWKDCYPIYEIVEADIGGETALVSKGWVSRNQITRFARTAGHPKAAGDHARHGVSRVEPPPNPMTDAEGKAFIESLLTSWLTFKQQNQPLP
jgi:hypothetical protein